MKEFVIPNDIKDILETLWGKGLSVCPVGGCVRDFIMGRKVNDYDLAAEATPEELRAALEGYSCSFEGFDFGTIRVHTGNYHTEITCCRSDGSYSDHRKPDSVEYTRDISADLARRDFTVNAMAYDLQKGEVIDPFGGIADIEKGLIRCVGEPCVRFEEDALRILRAIRFASTLGFKVEEKTSLAAYEMRNSMKTLAGERIYTELDKLLLGDNVFFVLRSFAPIICAVIPELSHAVGFDQNNPHHKYTVYDHIACTVSACPKDRILRWTMLFHDIAKPVMCTVDEMGIYHFRGHPEKSAEIAEGVLRRLKSDGETIRKVKELITYHDVRPEPTKRAMHKYLCKVGFETARQLIHVRRADLSAQSPEYFYGFETIAECERLIDVLEAEGAAVKLSDLNVGGGDIMKELSIAPGPLVGRVLSHLLEMVSSGDCENERGELLSASKEYIDSNK